MNWQINDEDLDTSYGRIYNLSTNQSCVIKTSCSEYDILVLWKIYQQLDSTNQILVVYHSYFLKYTLERGCLGFDLDKEQITFLQQDNFYSLNNSQKYDYVFVLEMEEFTEIEIQKFMNFYKKSILFFGSDYQCMSRFKSNIEHTANLLKLPVYETLNSYRLPISVAYFIKALDANFDIVERCKNTSVRKPIIIKFSSWEEEICWIINQINTQLINGAIILLPHLISFGKLNSVKKIASFFKEKNALILNSLSNIEYDSTLPKLMTFAQSKFCLSEDIFIPFADKLQNTKEFRIALSQATSNVILTYSGELPNFIKQISVEFYEHIRK